MAALGAKRGLAAHDFPQAPPPPVALDRGADLLRYGEAEAGCGGIAALARLQHEGAGRNPRTLRGGEEIRPFSQPLHAEGRASAQADSRLRPRERRALSTLRPPFVARRARKPWR